MLYMHTSCKHSFMLHELQGEPASLLWEQSNPLELSACLCKAGVLCGLLNCTDGRNGCILECHVDAAEGSNTPWLCVTSHVQAMLIQLRYVISLCVPEVRIDRIGAQAYMRMRWCGVQDTRLHDAKLHDIHSTEQSSDVDVVVSRACVSSKTNRRAVRLPGCTHHGDCV